MLHAIQRVLALALVVVLAGCFADTPSEPSQPRAEASPSLSVVSSAVGNITDLGTAGLAGGAINQLIYTVGGRNSSRLLPLNERLTP